MTLALLFWMGGNDTGAAVAPQGAGSGAGRKKKPPQIRLRNGRLYQPETYEEFRRLLAKIEYRAGYKPLMALPTAKIASPQADFARWSAQITAQQQLLLEKQRLMLEEEEAALALLLLSVE